MKGILFSKELLPKVHDGTKTVTRRVLNPQPLPEATKVKQHGEDFLYGTGDGTYAGDNFKRIKPRYHEGETVYVKEVWATLKEYDKLPPSKIPYDDPIWYKDVDKDFLECFKSSIGRWRSPLHMPEWASRTKLLITKVSVERLQEITEEEAKLEGATCHWDEGDYLWKEAIEACKNPHSDGWAHASLSSTYRFGFQILWNSLNKERGYSWESNPWVFRYQFERVSTPNKREG